MGLHDNRIIYPNDEYEHSKQTNEIKPAQNRFGDIENQNVLSAYREDELVDLHSYDDETGDEISNQEKIDTFYKLPLVKDSGLVSGSTGLDGLKES